MKNTYNALLELHKFVVIFEQKKNSEFWKIGSLRKIAHYSGEILKKRDSPELQAIFINQSPKELEKIDIRFETMETIVNLCTQQDFLEPLFKQLEKMKNARDPSLKKVIAQHHPLQVLIGDAVIPVKLLRLYPMYALFKN